MKQTTTRIISLDILRIVASMSVVTWHVAMPLWREYNIGSNVWLLATLIRILSRWISAVYVMISGSFFLNNERPLPIKTLYSKYIYNTLKKRLLWSIISLLVDWKNMKSFPPSKVIIERLINGHGYHWFLSLILILYVITPILRMISSSQQILLYALSLSGVSCFVVEPLSKHPMRQLVSPTLRFFPRISSWIGLYLSGFYIRHHVIPKKIRLLSYAVGLLSVIRAYYYTVKESIQNQVLKWTYFEDSSFLVIASGIAIFMFFNQLHLQFTDTTAKRILKVSKATFGVYLLHPFLLRKITQIRHIMTRTICPVLVALPICSILLFTICFLVAFVLGDVPVVSILF